MTAKKIFYYPTLIVFSCANIAFARETLTVWSSPAAATPTIITQQTMQLLDKSDIAHALTLTPGVILQKSGNRNEWLAQVRGFNSRQVPIFYDGIPIYVPYDGNFDLGRLLTANIASLEVNKGFTSLLQGPNQMGGAINITTRKPDKPLQGAINYRQGWSRGKDNLSDADAAFSLCGDAAFLQLSATRRKRQFIGLPRGYSHSAGGSQRELINSDATDRQGMVKLGFTPRINDEYFFTLLYQNTEKNSSPYTGTAPVAPRYWQWPQYDKIGYYYQGVTHIGPNITLKSRAWHDTFKNTLLMYNSLTALKRHDGSYSHYSDYSNGWGLELIQERHRGDLFSLSLHEKQDAHREKSAEKAPWNRFKDRTWSIASEYQRNVTESLEMVGGVSYDWRHSLEGIKHRSAGQPAARYSANHQHAFNWQALAKYRFTDDNVIILSLADRSRFPTQKERYTTSRPAFNQTALINPFLRPERAYILDITNNGRLSDTWHYSLSFYYNRVSDAILKQNIDADTIQNRNSGRVNYKGIDFSIKGNLNEQVQSGLNYGLLHSRAQQKMAGKIIDTPRHSLTGWLSYSPRSTMRITFSEEARSSSYSSSDGSRKAAGFAVTHLRADFMLMRDLSLNFSVNNLFDHKYAYTEGFIEEGRSYLAGVSWSFH